MIKTKDSKWMISPLLFNISLGPLSTLITLEILNLGGNSLDVAYAITVSNIVLIPASIFWGMLSDRIDLRKIILTGFLTTSLLLLVAFFIKTIPLLISDYGAITFFSTSYNTPMNLLVMETSEKSKWASNFSKLSMFSSIGMLIGLIISTFLVLFIRIFVIYLILGIIAISSFILAYKYTPRTMIGIERNSMIHTRESFFTRLRMHPLIFLHLPNIHSFKMFRLSRLTKKPINYLPLLYLAIFIFYISSGLFNTLYPASLYEKGLDKSIVLGIITEGMLVQILTFHGIGKFLESRDEKEVSFMALLLRGSGYILMGISLIFTSIITEIFGIIFYPLSAGLAYSAYYSASNTLIFKAVGGRRQGTTLGVYSTLVGIAMFIGSLASGYISSISFTVNFIIAGILLFISASIFKYIEEG
ncbi:MFS transporter [Acidianus sulfidivorans JP7]|uniref:MFS transporter n=1 Tax=Acidianus sulfidivorans JP7 TaxID=619593 RepID=A0A2U9IK84_9CREN|nr:MFS transporter [Acidianus sulfidivorans]AWR96433.1 MFS transporter [Acidianus sulfidivorans JP7]